MSHISLVKPHSLPIAKAKALVEKAANGLASEYDLTSEWHGNSLRFHRSGVDGHMAVTASEIRLDIKLGLLLRPMKGKLLDQLENELDRLFADQPKVQKKVTAKRKTAKKSARTRA